MSRVIVVFFVLIIQNIQAQVNGVYTLPIFEVNQSDTFIVGVRNGDSDSELSCMSGKKMGVYLNNPFQKEKYITQAQIKFEKIGKKVSEIRLEIYAAKDDSFPAEIVLFDTLFEVSRERNYWLNINIPKIKYPSHGVVIAYTLITKDGKLLSEKQTGSIAAKTFSEPHRIRFECWEDKWYRYPFEEWRNDPTIGLWIREREKKVPLLSLTLVNAD